MGGGNLRCGGARVLKGREAGSGLGRWDGRMEHSRKPPSAVEGMDRASARPRAYIIGARPLGGRRNAAAVKRSAVVRVSGLWTSSNSSRPPARHASRARHAAERAGWMRVPAASGVGAGGGWSVPFFVLRDGRSGGGGGGGRREFGGVTWTAPWGLGLIGS